MEPLCTASPLNSLPLPCTALMCVEVTAIVPPLQQAFLRTAGSVGAAAYTEVVAQGRSTLWVEYTNINDDAVVVDKAPITLPITVTPSICRMIRTSLDKSSVLVLDHAYLHTHKVTISDLPTHYFTHMRYVGGSSCDGSGGGDAVKEIGFVFSPPLASHNKNAGVLSITMEEFKGITTILNHFMTKIVSLISIDISPLVNVTTIGDMFLGGCSSLTTINLTPFINVTKIGHFFMFGCSSITTIDLHPLRNVLSIGSLFLAHCSSLQSIDVGPLHNITSLPSHFMSGCLTVTSIDLSPLTSVTSIGSSFMRGCVALTHVTGFTSKSLLSLDKECFAGCDGLPKSFNITNNNNADSSGGVTISSQNSRKSLIKSCLVM